MESLLCVGLPGAQRGCLKPYQPLIHAMLAECLWHPKSRLLREDPLLGIVFRVSEMIFSSSYSSWMCGKKPWLILLSRKPGCLDSVPSSARAPSSGTWPITSLQQGFIQHCGKFRGPDWLPIREIHIHLGQSPRAIILSVAFQKVSQNSAEIFRLHRQLLSLPLYPLHFGKLLLLW